MSDALTEVSDCTRHSSVEDSSMDVPDDFDVTSHTVQDMTETSIADRSTASSNASLSNSLMSMCSLEDTVVLETSPGQMCGERRNEKLSSTDTDCTIDDVIDMSETVCLSESNDETEDAEPVMNRAARQDQFSGPLLPDDDLGCDGSVEGAEMLRSRPSPENCSIASDIEAYEGDNAREVSSIHSWDGQDEGGDNSTTSTTESPGYVSPASSSDDGFYMPCRKASSNASATGRFLLGRRIRGPRSSGEGGSSEGSDDGFLYASGSDSSTKRSERGDRCHGNSRVLGADPKDSTRVRSGQFSSFGSAAKGKSRTGSKPKDTCKRPVPVSSRGVPLSPIAPTHDGPQQEQYAEHCQCPPELSPDEDMPQDDEIGATTSAEATGGEQEAVQAVRIPVYRRHHDLSSGEDILDKIFDEVYRNHVPRTSTDFRPGNRFFRYANLRKTYMKHYISNPALRRVCKHSRKYFEDLG